MISAKWVWVAAIFKLFFHPISSIGLLEKLYLSGGLNCSPGRPCLKIEELQVLLNPSGAFLYIWLSARVRTSVFLVLLSILAYSSWTLFVQVWRFYWLFLPCLRLCFDMALAFPFCLRKLTFFGDPVCELSLFMKTSGCYPESEGGEMRLHRHSTSILPEGVGQLLESMFLIRREFNDIFIILSHGYSRYLHHLPSPFTNQHCWHLHLTPKFSRRRLPQKPSAKAFPPTIFEQRPKCSYSELLTGDLQGFFCRRNFTYLMAK